MMVRSPWPNATSRMGVHATAGNGSMTLRIGLVHLWTDGIRPRQKPSGIPMSTLSAKALMARYRLAPMCLNSMPCSGPVEKSCSLARAKIIDGEGKMFEAIHPALTASSQNTSRVTMGSMNRPNSAYAAKAPGVRRAAGLIMTVWAVVAASGFMGSP